MQNSSCSRRAKLIPHHLLRSSFALEKNGLTSNPERRSSLLYRCVSSPLRSSWTVRRHGAGPLAHGRGGALRAMRTWLLGLEETVYHLLLGVFMPSWVEQPCHNSPRPVSPLLSRWYPSQPGCCWRCSQGSFPGQQTAFGCRSQTRISKTTWWSSSKSSITSGSPSSGCRRGSRPLLWQASMLARRPGPCTQLACNSEATDRG